jgi:hypothetical protein
MGLSNYPHIHLNSHPLTHSPNYFLTYLPIYPSNYLPTQAVPRLRRLVAGFLLRRLQFESRLGHLGYVVDKVALGPLLLPILIPPIAPHSSSIVRCWYNRPEVAAVYLPTYLLTHQTHHPPTPCKPSSTTIPPTQA